MKTSDRRSFLHTTLSLPFASSVTWAADGKTRPPFQIGLSDSLISGQMNRAVAPMLVQTLGDLFVIAGKPRAIFRIDNSPALAKSLQERKIQLAIMTGIEYGWLGQSLQKLMPLATAYTSDIRLKACIVVHADTQVKSLLELHRKTIVLPKRSQFHTLVYLHHAIGSLGKQPEEFFGHVLISDDVNDGIENVVDKEAIAVLVDVDSWKGYQERKPGRARKLTIIAQSYDFPTAAVLYDPESWKTDDLKQLKDVLVTAHQRAFSRQVLNLWRISKFVPYTAEYEQVVRNIVCEIPLPVVPAVFARNQ